MTEIIPGLSIGGESSCQIGTDSLAVVHACKHPCHVKAVGYVNKLASDHPNYLILEDGYDLYMNIIDPKAPLFQPASFLAFLRFARVQRSKGRNLLIHCNQGHSRAPSLALLYLAKVEEALPTDSFESARREFETMFSGYDPGQGIVTFLTRNWTEIT